MEDLTEADHSDLAWLPGPFLPPAILPAAIRATHTALKPGAWVLFGLYATSDDDLARALVDLRVRRSGGQMISADGAAALLRDGGFEAVHEVRRDWLAPMLFVAGRRA